jgi:hypothetical protein
MSMAATKISRFFIIFAALLQQDRRLQRKRNKNDNRPIYQAGAHQQPQLLPIKGAHEIGLPTDGDRSSNLEKAYVKRNSSSSAAKRPRFIPFSRHIFDYDYTDFDGAFAYTLKETTRASRWIACTTIHPAI